MKKMYKAFVKDKEDGRKLFIESEYTSKSAFIKDLRCNGYAVNQKKVKLKVVYDFILEHTDCYPWDYEEYNTIQDIEEKGGYNGKEYIKNLREVL